MLVKDIRKQIVDETLTYSDVVAILFKQPVADGTSHAHMHTRDGFTSTTIGKSGLGLDDAHLVQDARGLTSYDASTLLTTVVQEGVVYIDANRVVKSGIYSNRTGLPAQAAVLDPSRKRFKVFLPIKNNKPQLVEVQQSDYPGIDFTNITANDITQIATANAPSAVLDLSKKFVVSPIAGSDVVLPARDKDSPAHSMFPDSESMVMHLTASLYSKAGRRALFYLDMKPEGETVGIFSKTAADYVESVEAKTNSLKNDANLRRLMVERVRNTDTSGSVISGFTTATKKIDHIELILARSSSGDMIVVTCYPTAKSTKDSIGTVTLVNEDICEPTLGTHLRIATQSYPDLKW